MHALNFGIGGERTEHVLWRCLNGEMENMKPKVSLNLFFVSIFWLDYCLSFQAVVLLIGTNNHGCTPEQIGEGILSIVDVIRSKQSQAEILVLVGSYFVLFYYDLWEFDSYSYNNYFYFSIVVIASRWTT